VQDDSKKPQIEFKNCTFCWKSKKEPTLTDIDLNIFKGNFVVIVGRVGTGKSSLLSALLGDMKKCRGECNVPNRFSYVPQVPPIFQASLKSNIIMHSELGEDKTRLESVIFASGLEPDLASLRGGLDCEVREKSLSGGQRLRVGLARALYQKADVYLLDDVFSAVDVMVAKHIFQYSILGTLKTKTRILVTHQEFVLPYADWIIQMEDGRIVHQGTYNDMKCHFKDFSESEIEKTSAEVGDQTSEDTALAIEEEEMEVGVIKWEVMQYYFEIFGWMALISFILILFAAEGFATMKDWWISHWSQSDENSNLGLGLGLFVGLSTGYAVFGLVHEFILIWGTQQASKQVHKDLLDSILRSPIQFFNITPSGRILNRFSKDQEAIDTRIARPMKDFWRCISYILVSVTIVCISSPYLIIGIPLLAVFYYKVQDYFRIAMRQIKRHEAVSASPIFSHLSETLHGTNVIRAHRFENSFCADYIRLLDKNSHMYLTLWCANRWLNIRLGLMGIIVVSACGISGLVAKWFDSINPSLFGLALVYSVEITGNLNWAARQVAEMEVSMNAVERIKQYIEIPHEAARSVPATDSLLPDGWPAYGQITFNEVVMSYSPELEPALQGATFSIKAGEKVGICGRTGAGKSTILNVLFRFQELTSGTIIIDGVDISQIGLDRIRQGISIIPQTPILFSGTLRQNLDPFNHHDDNTLWSILESVSLKTKVEGFTEGLAFMLEESGTNFSVGERQLLCMARALCENSKIILLDEATAACDKETDEAIQRTVRSQFSTGTVITIAHRINTILDYDKIIVMEKGRVKEMGHPQDLINDSTTKFYQLWKNQQSL